MWSTTASALRRQGGSLGDFERPYRHTARTVMSQSLPPYNPQHGYVPVRATRSAQRQQATVERTPGRTFTKNLVLLASDDHNVPRGTRREDLHKFGVIISLVDFHTSWDEVRMEFAIEEALSGTIDYPEKPHPR